MSNTIRQPSDAAVESLWITFPSAIAFIKKNRDKRLPSSDTFRSYLESTGINATIILLSAASIEGFLSECLHSFSQSGPLNPKDTFQKRLDNDYFNRISTATFGQFVELFKVALGKPLSELITDKELLLDVVTLIDFRNGLAHSKSISYLGYTVPNSDKKEYELGGQYEKVYAYLKKKKLLIPERNVGIQSLFSNKIANHFSGVIRKYMDEVVKVLPTEQGKAVRPMITMAFDV
jgi:hypothetical protein